MILDREKIDNFIWNNYRRMKSPEFMFGVDNNQDSMQDFKKADLRVLVCFLSPGSLRGYSSTDIVLNKLIHRSKYKVFVDFCYIPYKKDEDILKKNNIPMMFGNVSHSAYRDYDLIFISISVFMETINLPVMLNNSGIDLGYRGRLRDENTPPIYLGGASSLSSFILFGDVYEEDKSLVDISVFGFGEGVVENIVDKSVEFDKDIKKNKKEYFRYMMNSELKGKLFFPYYYDFVYDENELRLLDINKNLDILPDKIEMNKSSKDIESFTHKIFNLKGSGGESQNLIIARGCTGSGACSFCEEGNISGRYVEKDLKSLKEDLQESKKMGAVDSLGLFSYNINYYSKLMDLLYEVYKEVPKVNTISMRADGIAENYGFLKILRRGNVKEIGMAIEGMGDRIRNKLLNKNLNRSQIRKAVRNIFKLKYSFLKINMIITGYESEKDIKNWLRELDMILDEKEKMGANTNIRVVHNNLLIYNHTPLRWSSRISAKMSWYDRKSMNRYIKELKKRGIRMKFNKKGVQIYFNQLLLDLGVKGTRFLINMALRRDMRFYRYYSNLNRSDIKKELSEIGLEYSCIFRDRDIDEIFSEDIVNYVSDGKIEDWKNRYKKNDYRKDICLKSKVRKSPKCVSCGECSNKKEIEETINRDLKNEKSVNDVMDVMMKNNKKEVYRVILNQKEGWDFYNRSVLSRYVTSLYLRNSDRLLREFYSIGDNSLKWISQNGQDGWAFGKWVFDLYMKKKGLEDEFKNNIENINNKLISTQIIDVVEGEMEVKQNQSLLWIGEVSNISYQKMKDSLMRYDWRVEKAKRVIGRDMVLEKKYKSSLKDKILYIGGKDKIIVLMKLDIDINPYLVIKSILKDSYLDIREKSIFKVLEHIKDVGMKCDCGRNLSYSLINNEISKECDICKGKKLLYKIKER